MDTEVVYRIGNTLNKPETKAVLSEAGMRHGRLTVSGRNALGNVVLRCDCGETIRLSSSQLMSGKHYQCESCDRWDRKSPGHRLVGTSAYRSLVSRYHGAKDRCSKEDNVAYKSYGGRGIRCEFDGAEEYVRYLAPAVLTYGIGGQVDRIDNDGHYAVGNLRIISAKDNGRNRRTTILIDGVPLGEICESAGFNPMDDLKMYARISERVRYRIGAGDKMSAGIIKDIVRHARETPVVSESNARAKRQPVVVDGRALKDILEDIGLGGNKAIYNSTRMRIASCRNRDKQEPWVEIVQSWAMDYAKARGLA